MRPSRSKLTPAFGIVLASSICVSGATTQIPGGAGKETVEKLCTPCHAIDAHCTKYGSRDMVTDMAECRADGTPREAAR